MEIRVIFLHTPSIDWIASSHFRQSVLRQLSMKNELLRVNFCIFVDLNKALQARKPIEVVADSVSQSISEYHPRA